MSKPYKKKSIPKELKRQVWENTFGNKLYGNCVCCSQKIHCYNAEMAHIQAESKGGSTNAGNLTPTCLNCNRSMGTQNLFEFKQKFVNKSGCNIM